MEILVIIVVQNIVKHLIVTEMKELVLEDVLMIVIGEVNVKIHVVVIVIKENVYKIQDIVFMIV